MNTVKVDLQEFTLTKNILIIAMYIFRNTNYNYYRLQVRRFISMLENVKNELINELDSQQLNQLMTAVNNLNGYFEDQIWISMDCFDDYLFGLTPLEIASRVAYGNFDPSHDDYFRFDIYGHLESATECDVERDILDSADEIIELALANWGHISSDLDDDLVELIENAMGENTDD